MQKPDFLYVPVELSKHVYACGLTKSFGVYLYMKIHSSGKMHKDDPAFKKMQVILRMTDPRTLKNHLEPLIEENWIGYNAKSGYYFIRSFDYLRAKYNFRSRQATRFHVSDFNKMQTYLAAVLLSSEVRGQKYVWEDKRRNHRAVTKQKDVTNHSRDFSKNSPKPPYYGLCNRQIAKKVLKCSKTRATELKLDAAKAGYIDLVQHTQQIMLLEKRNFRLRADLENLYPDLKNKILFEKVTVKKKRMIRVYRQLHTEIIPKILFRTINKFNNLQVSVCVLREFRITGHSLQAAA